MECSKCHIENPDDNKFCRECGTALVLTCTECGNQLQAGDKFCGKCGQQVIKQVKDKKSQLTVEGERKHITVLFSDMSGYTALSEKLDPEEVKEITGRIFGEVSKIIAKYDGFVEKYAGDAIMALFGVNQSQEGDPVRAVMSAREIHDVVKALSPQYEEKIGQPLSMHSGINTGLVVTGNVEVERGTHGVAGDTINVAARLSAAAKAGDILIDHETFKRTEGYFQFEDLEPVQLKGKKNAVQIHRYLAIKDQPQKVHRLHGLRAELIGRKAEMAQLSEAVDRLRQGKGAVFSIIGTAGTGKSRLVEEFKDSLDLKEVQWLEGHAFPYAQNIPYIPFIDLNSKAIQIDEGDAPQTVKEKLESGLEALIGETQGVVPYIGSLYALNYPEIEGVSPEFWKAELQKAVLKVLTALAQRAPTVICLEDLHWADPSTIELLHFLLFEIRHPVLFFCVYRPIISLFSTHQIKDMAFPHQELNLQDLSLSEAQNMVESLLQTDTVPWDLQQFIRDKVEGNPFYLEEAINSLIESKTLVPENGKWQVAGPITESEISATIQGVISARVDRLEHESKRILQEASVIGRSFYHEILKRISEIKDNIDANLRGLERFDLIKTKSIQPYLEYIFKHALTQEVVYNGLLKKERREIHERIGYVIEELFKDRLPEFYETLAFHFKNGYSVDKAVKYLMLSGEKSLRRYSVDESHQSYKQAFELLAGISDLSLELKKRLIHLLFEWALVFYYRGDFKGLHELFSSHENLAADINNDEDAGMFFAWHGFAVYFRGDVKASYQYLLKALKLGEQSDSKHVIGYACSWLPFTCAVLGRLDEAIAFGERAREISKYLSTDQYLFFKSLSGLGFAHWSRGECEKALKAGKTILDYGRLHSNIRSTVMGHWIIGQGHLAKGDFEAAIDSFKMSAQSAKDPFYLISAKHFLGISYILSGQFDEAENVVKEVITYGQTYGCELFSDMNIGFQGVVMIVQGHMSKGLSQLEETHRVFLKRECKAICGIFEYILGKVYSQIAAGPKPAFSIMAKNMGFLVKNMPLAGKRAEEHLGKEIEMAKEIGAKGFLGMSYMDLGMFHEAKSKTDAARKCICEAIKIFEETEAEGYLKQAKEALDSLN